MFNQKDLLAKLLATEDVTVLHAKAKTASFDVKSRVLTLPVWNEMTDATYDHLTGHEVGHALYTPYEGWRKELDKGLGDGYKSFVNVVEDARIEKLIQRRYPGLRRSFIKSYKKMLADGFFGADIEKINTYPLIDRINTYFKAGASAGVRIEDDEKVWIDEIENLETWDGVTDVATRLYEYAKTKKEEEEELAQQLDHEFGDEDGDADGDAFDSDEFRREDFDGNDENGEDQNGSPEDGDEGDELESELGRGDIDDVRSKTDDALTRNIDSNYNNDSGIDVMNVMMNNNDVSPMIIDYKTIISDFAAYDEKLIATGQQYGWSGDELGMMVRGEEFFTKFNANNKKAISYLTKEFEMRKSAKEYVRATTAKTGVIDPIKMNSYQYNDDIFKKVSIVPEGKSHGMIMYLDWSGSMHHDMKATIDQLLNLVNFCRNTNIPFRVYAFTNGFGYGSSIDNRKLFDGLNDDKVAIDTLFYDDTFRYLELFNSKMRKKDFVTMSKYLLAYGENPQKSPYDYHLNGTPLDVAIMGASKLHELFLKNHRVDIVNTIFLTDGDSHGARLNYMNSFREYEDPYKMSATLDDLTGWRFKGQLNIIDPDTKKVYPLVENMLHQDITELFLKIYREKTGSTTVGFRILPNTLGRVRRELGYLGWDTDYSSLAKDMRKDKYCVIPSTGYTKYFGIAGGKELETANGAFEVTGDETTAQLRNAFKKASKNKVSSRALLSEFIREVA